MEVEGQVHTWTGFVLGGRAVPARVQVLLWVFPTTGREEVRKDDARLGGPSAPARLQVRVPTGGAGARSPQVSPVRPGSNSARKI